MLEVMIQEKRKLGDNSFVGHHALFFGLNSFLCNIILKIKPLSSMNTEINGLKIFLCIICASRV